MNPEPDAETVFRTHYLDPICGLYTPAERLEVAELDKAIATLPRYDDTGRRRELEDRRYRIHGTVRRRSEQEIDRITRRYIGELGALRTRSRRTLLTPKPTPTDRQGDLF